MIIYKTTNKINNHYYIGKDQKNSPLYLGSGIALKRAIDKYGRENFIKEVLEECSDPKTLAAQERAWIAKYNATKDPMSYNIAEGGFGGHTGAYYKVGRSGPANAAYGKHKTPEQKEKQRTKILQYLQTADPAKLAARNLKSKIAQKGKPKNQESTAKMTATRRQQALENQITFKKYTLVSPTNQTFYFAGKYSLVQWCKDNGHSYWTVECRLLKHIQPKSGTLVGWYASVEHEFIKSRRERPANT